MSIRLLIRMFIFIRVKERNYNYHMKKNNTSKYLSATLIAALVFVGAQFVQAQTTDTTASGTTGLTSGTPDTSGAANNNTTNATTNATPDASANPALPNTGAGGEAATNVAILLASGLIAVGGTVLLTRKLAR